MNIQELFELTHAAKLRIHSITSTVAYAIAALERDPAPIFQLGTVVRMGLSDEEVSDPATIEIMRWEYRVWIIGHALADISESIATLLNEIVKLESALLGYEDQFIRFERLGLDRKLHALPKLILDEDYVAAIDSITKARNCLIHRHGIIGSSDCNGNQELILTWRGIIVSKTGPHGEDEIEFEPSYRGPAAASPNGLVKLLISSVTRKFPLGSRLNFEPNDLCTLAWCLGGIILQIETEVKRLIEEGGATEQTVQVAGEPFAIVKWQKTKDNENSLIIENIGDSDALGSIDNFNNTQFEFNLRTPVTLILKEPSGNPFRVFYKSKAGNGKIFFVLINYEDKTTITEIVKN
ncbi:hypothetical protein ACFQ1T_06070 [Methylophilus glucosoxydans]|uniref:Uncharacterized protein n=1 Tax=Methylophilus glucosoxydans TaxID=752553 RepID=A0ABW3GFN6_9PROT